MIGTTGTGPHDACQVVLAASFTAQPIAPVVEFWARELALPIDLSFCPYDQIFQELLDAEAAMARNASGVNVILVRLEDLTRADAGPRAVGPAADELATAVHDAAARWLAPILVVVCPPSPRARGSRGGRALDDAESRLASRLRGSPAVHVLCSAQVHDWYPEASSYDEYADRLGHIPYSASAFVALGTAVARGIYRLLAPEPKVIVVDGDNTLWDGVVGEDDHASIRIGPSRQRIQDLLSAQRRAGRLLCLCSRNTEADTLAVLDRHHGMRLSAADFAAIRVNWGPKSANLRAIAAELGLGLDSFVFVDDSPVECAEVREHCPEVVVLPVPPDAEDAERFLRHSWILDVGGTTAEDRQRAAYYGTEVERSKMRSAAPSLAAFLASLGLKVHVTPATSTDVPRIAQLTQRTNQFNMTTVRRTEAEVSSLLTTRDCLVVTAEDRFGRYGTVGLAVLEEHRDALRLETFLLSCRALGRGIEHQVLANVGRVARDRGLQQVELVYRGTRRNQPAADFVREVCRLPKDGDLPDGQYRLPAAEAAEVRHVPADRPPPAKRPMPAAKDGSDTVSVGRALWMIADRTSPDLATCDRIEARMRSRPGGAARSMDDAVAVIMADVLGLPSVSRTSNFFELGGTSVQLVQFMSRVREYFGIELPMDALYNSELTAANVAATVLVRSVDVPGRMNDVLALLESMTDAQVEAMLDRMDESRPR